MWCTKTPTIFWPTYRTPNNFSLTLSLSFCAHQLATIDCSNCRRRHNVSCNKIYHTISDNSTHVHLSSLWYLQILIVMYRTYRILNVALLSSYWIEPSFWDLWIWYFSVLLVYHIQYDIKKEQSVIWKPFGILYLISRQPFKYI